MNINLSKFKSHWFEDQFGNVIDGKEHECVTENTEGILYYHSAFPCRFVEEVSEYCWHPKNPFIKWLCKNRKIYNILSKGKYRTYRQIYVAHTTYNSGSDCIVAMVNSGDYTLEQAIWIYATACERCMNVLCYKYLNGEDGYEEHSEEWEKCNTECQFCKGE